MRVQDPRAAKLLIFKEGPNSPAPQPPSFQQTKCPPSLPTRLAEHPDPTLSSKEGTTESDSAGQSHSFQLRLREGTEDEDSKL